jgi:hypothetical protein
MAHPLVREYGLAQTMLQPLLAGDARPAQSPVSARR